MLADTLRLLKLPPYSPGLNPVEHRWGDLREKPEDYRIFSSIDVFDLWWEEQGVACATPNSANDLRGTSDPNCYRARTRRSFC